MSDDNRIQRVRNHLTFELGVLSEEQNAKIGVVLRKFMASLKVLLILADGQESCCATCPLVEESDEWDGFATTAYGILKSYRDGTPFVCHLEQTGHEDRYVDIYKLKLCGGLDTVMNASKLEIRNLVAVTLAAIRLVVPLRTLSRVSMAGKNAN